jgi:hypothetical protein
LFKVGLDVLADIGVEVPALCVLVDKRFVILQTSILLKLKKNFEKLLKLSLILQIVKFVVGVSILLV